MNSTQGTAVQLGAVVDGKVAACAPDPGALDCDPHLLTVLARANARLTASGDSFTLVGLQLPEFIDVLPRARLDEIFIVYDVVRSEAGRSMAASTSSRPASPSGGRHRR